MSETLEVDQATAFVLNEQQAKIANAYTERNALVAALSKIFPSHLARHPEDDASWERDWMWIVFISTPSGQLSWHLHDAHLPMFAHLSEGPNVWDGHTTEEKYARLARLG